MSSQAGSEESKAIVARAIAAPSVAEDVSIDHPTEWEYPEEAEEGEKLDGAPAPPKAPQVPRPKRREKVNFCTQLHNEFTHFPLDPNCPICQRAKPQRSGMRSKVYGRPDDLPKPEAFGDSITADHAILNDILPSDYEKVACIIQDRHTSFMMGFPARSKNALDLNS